MELATKPQNGETKPVLANNHQTLKNLLETAKQQIADALPSHLTPDRMIRVALVAVSRTPLLQKCTAHSILKCVMVSSQLGLEASGVLGEAYMVPFWNKNIGAHEAQLIPGYRGLIKLARQSGDVVSVEARAVYTSDFFEFEQGLQPKLIHRPDLDGDMDDDMLRLVYAIARFKNVTSEPQTELMTKKQIDKIRGRSKASAEGPWVTDYIEMCRKTVLKRLMKYLPMSTELQTAVELDNRYERGEPMPEIVDGMIIDEPSAQAVEAAKSRTEKLAEKIESRKKAPVAQPRPSPSDDTRLPTDHQEHSPAETSPSATVEDGPQDAPPVEESQVEPMPWATWEILTASIHKLASDAKVENGEWQVNNAIKGALLALRKVGKADQVTETERKDIWTAASTGRGKFAFLPQIES